MSSTEPGFASSVGAPSETSVSPAEGLVGTTIADRYRVEALIGEGGMGAVYRVEHMLMRKRLALKVLHPEMSRNAEVVARFEREAMAAAHIEHPNVAAATDFGRTDDGAFFLVLEYVEGTSLAKALRNGAFTAERAVLVARQIALALVRAHELGIVHRDLKPDNVMLVDRGEAHDVVKVLDFGIAKATDGVFARSTSKPGEVLTRAGAIFGTPEYMAPEQALGEVVDARSDLYSLGAILYEMLTGHLPFDGGDITKLLGQIITQPVPPISVRAPERNVPSAVDAVVMRLLEKQADKRYASAKDLIAALDDAALASGFARRPGSGHASRATFSGLPPLSHAPTVAAMPLAARARKKLPSRTAILIGAGALIVTASALSFSLGGRAQEAGTTVAAIRELVQEEPRPGLTDAEVKRATDEGADALEALAVAHPSEARVPRALYRVYADAHRYPEAMRMITKLVALDPTAAADSEVVAAVLASAASGGEAADAAFALMEGPMGERGVDAIYDLATSGKASPVKTRALQELAKPSVRGHASRATLVLLDLREAKGCEGRRAVMPRAKEHGDARALAALKPLTATRGCGFLSLNDCYKCLRADGSLREAIAAIEARTR